MLSVMGFALVVFGAATPRPTIVCLREEAVPAPPPPSWLVLGRESEIVAAEPSLPPRSRPDVRSDASE
jgi:hypothetical protein